MTKGNITRSPLVASFLTVAMGFQSPAGHDALYQGLLRIWFAPQWFEAMRQTGETMSFDAFKNSDMAQIWVYDPNPDVFLKNIKLLQSNFSLCLPFVGDEKDQPSPPQNFACHATAARDNKKDKKTACPC